MMDIMNVDGMLHLLAAEPTLLPLAPSAASGDDIAARVAAGGRACLRCGQPAATALIADTPHHGRRWLDLCMKDFNAVRRDA